MGAYGNTDAAFPGLEYGLDVHSEIDTGIAQEQIAFGAPVFRFLGAPDQVWGPHIDESTVTLSTGLATSNVFAGTITVTYPDGTTKVSAALSVSYATSAKATMDAMVAAINADTNMIAAGVSASDNSGGTVLTIIVTPVAGSIVLGDLTVNLGVTGGTPPTVTTAYLTQMEFAGVAQFEQRASRLYGAGIEAFFALDAVNIKRRGRLWVVGADTPAEGALAYPIIGGTNKGKFTQLSGPSGGYVYAPNSSSPLSGIQPMFRGSIQAVNGVNLMQLDVRGIY